MLPHAQQGQGDPTFVLLHYMGGSHRSWFPTLPFLDRTHRCIVMNTPGYGDAAAIPGWDVKAMADHFDRTIRRLLLSRVILVGHSMTAKVAMVLAASAPAYLHGMILVGPSPLTPQPISDEARRSQLTFSNRRDQAEAFVDGATARRLPDAVREVAVTDVMRCNPDAFHAWAGAGMNEDWSTRIGQIDCPTLVVCGERDESVPSADGQRELTLPHLSKGQLASIPEAGHLMPMESPQALSTLMLGFADTLLTSGRLS
jgi:pimeloyl-ACP methyl ester carboxylesterase